MRKLIFAFLILFLFANCYSQSYLGWITKSVNFRTGPGTEYDIISTLKKGSQIFIISLETINDYYNIIDIESNEEGYVHKSYVKIGEKVDLNKGEVFKPSGKISSSNSIVEIFNNTEKVLTLKLNDVLYSFDSYEKRKITLKPGFYNYRASVPGVIPNIGTQKLEAYTGYYWEFYIVKIRK